jgi:hypothetical protein
LVRFGPFAGALIALAFGTLLVGFFVVLKTWDRGPREVHATVVEHRWRREVLVDRYALRGFEGFAEDLPADAIDVKSLGDRHHHDEQVLDGTRTEYYSEQVPDGYDTRTSWQQVACGEDCVTEPQYCHEECSDDGNGFATCEDVCSGGGQSCTTRYCSEQVSEQVPRYRTEQRSREVPNYRSEPRYAEAFGWHAWTWAVDRDLKEEGTGLEPKWPGDDVVHLRVGLAEGEDERETRQESYSVVLRGVVYDAPRDLPLDGLSEAAWRAYVPGSEHVVLFDHGEIVAIDPAP